jgi:hypothetical protein
MHDTNHGGPDRHSKVPTERALAGSIPEFLAAVRSAK